MAGVAMAILSGLAMCLLCSLQGCGGSSVVHAPQAPRSSDYKRQAQMKLELQDLREQVKGVRQQNDLVKDLKCKVQELERKEEERKAFEEDLRRREEEAQNYPAPAFLIASNYLEYINIAITGGSGTGKSHLHNTLRRVKRQDASWAPVGVIETTKAPTMYNFPGLPARFWDLPGAGTPTFPLESYTKTVGLRHFDVVLVVCAERFTEIDVRIMKELDGHGVPYFPIRQKVGEALRNNLHVNGIDEDQTKQEIVDYLTKQGIQQAYLVDSFEPDKHDLPKLRREVSATIAKNRGMGGAESFAEL
ncbi:unnamed protein product [Effrenium voratum]|uniref:IRG-type G domain-containing protein n=1 Tax=Effrenium voratum TaxID=2562239 RepID=A0AA36J8F9_9DINO|nr:unnamed protein product [Effrenium voratum]CAJ1419477.1 unnamed protein product [Effrenium voratum]